MPLSISMIAVLVSSSVVTIISQTLFKRAANIVAASASPTTNLQKFTELLVMPSFLFAIFLYGVAFILWMWLLSKTTLSILYPIGLSLNVILALIAAHYFLSESITLFQLVGVFIIIIGLFIVAR